MNTFNRIIMVLAIILALAVVVFIMMRPLQAVDLARVGLDRFEQALFDAQFFYIFLAASGGIALILLILLWLELRRRRQDFVQVDIEGGGRAKLSIASVAQNLEYRIAELPGVSNVIPRIKSRGKDLDVIIDLETDPPVNIPTLSAKIVDLCRNILEDQLGVKIHNKVQVNVQHEPYPRGAMPAEKPREKANTEVPAPEEKAQKEAEPPEPAPTSMEQEEEESTDEETEFDETSASDEEISTNW